MDVLEAIETRKSIKAYKPDPVPLDLLKKIVGQALHAPSWGNTQPWEFAVAGGRKLKGIQEAFVKRWGEKNREEAKPDVGRPYVFPMPYKTYTRDHMALERTFLAEADVKNRDVDNFRNYGAPACIYLLIRRAFVYQTKGVNVWPLYDCGAAVQNILLLATANGLGTVPQARAVIYPDIIREALGIPEDRLIVLAIAIGYPDWDKQRNKMRSTRQPLEKVATFYGF
jgi:nitroreductase